MPKRLRSLLDFLQKHANAWWYAPAIALLAAADAFVIVVPTDGLLVSASMLAPRRWVYHALIVTVGSALGAWALAAILETHGLPFLLHLNPGLEETRAWVWSDRIMDNWGGYALFLISLSPIMQQPAVALAALAGMPLSKIFLLVFAGRVLKYGFLAWISTHAPGLLKRLWGLEKELKEAGVDGAKGTIPPISTT
jgi:membrane protein YqaA with SNARE-associated domain